LKGRLVRLIDFVPEFIDSLEGLLRYLNPNADVVRVSPPSNWQRKQPSYEEPHAVKHAEIFVLLNANFSIFSLKRCDNVRSEKREFELF
jgi:hypothetical protein